MPEEFKCKHGQPLEQACFECDYPGQMEAYYKAMKEAGFK